MTIIIIIVIIMIITTPCNNMADVAAVEKNPDEIIMGFWFDMCKYYGKTFAKNRAIHGI